MFLNLRDKLWTGQVYDIERNGQQSSPPTGPFLREHLLPRWLLVTLAHEVRIKWSAGCAGAWPSQGMLWLLFPVPTPLPRSVTGPQRSRRMAVSLLSLIHFPCAFLKQSCLLLGRQFFPFFLTTSCSPRTQTLNAVLKVKAERCLVWLLPDN